MFGKIRGRVDKRINKSVVHGASIPPTTLTLLRSISMTIYKKRTHHSIYRRIYERHYGPIPKDEEGRKYEIHHKDGDSSNNVPSNLVALSIKEHYEVHWSQGDWAACLMMSERMKVSPEEKSELARKSMAKQMENRPPYFSIRDMSGVNHPRHDKTIHHFIHLDGTEKKCTIYELRTEYNLNGQSLREMINGVKGHHSVKGWRLYGTPVPVLGDKPNEEIYHFAHKNGDSFVGTYYEFRTKFNLNPGHVSTMIRNTTKSVKGWRRVL